MKTIYLCTPHKLGDFNRELAERIGRESFKIVGAFSHTPQDVTKKDIFDRNVELLKSADVFIAVFKDYGKDLTAEVGMAFAWNMPRFGIDYTALESDIMSFYGIGRIIKPEQLEETLKEYR